MIHRSRPSSRRPRPSGVRVELLEARDVPSGLSLLEGGGILPTLSEVTLTLVRVSEAVSEEPGVRSDLGDNWHLFEESRHHDDAWHPGNAWGRDGDWSDQGGGDEAKHDDAKAKDNGAGWKDEGKANKGKADRDQAADNAPPASPGQGRPADPVGTPAQPSRPASPGRGQAGDPDGNARTGTTGDDTAPGSRDESSATEGQEAGDVRSTAARAEAEGAAAPGVTSDAEAPPTTHPAAAVQPTSAPVMSAADTAKARVAEVALSSVQPTAAAAAGGEQHPPVGRAAGDYMTAPESESKAEALPVLLEAESAPEQQGPDPYAAGLLQEFAAFDAGALDTALGQFLRDLADPEAAEAWLSRLGPWLAVGAAGVGLASELARRHLRHTRRNLLRAAGPDGVSLTWFPELGNSLE